MATFGVTMSCTADYAHFAVASICSIRARNREVAICLFVDFESTRLTEAAETLAVTLRKIPPPITVPVDDEFISRQILSRSLKIAAVAQAPFDVFVYIDADTIVLEDIGTLGNELTHSGANRADVHMLLRRPVTMTLWDYGRLHFRDQDHDHGTLAALLDSTFSLIIPRDALDSLRLWNSGVIFAASGPAEPLFGRWLELYREMVCASTSAAFVLNDQLPLWLAEWELRQRLEVGELPLRWNFMPRLAIGLEPGTSDANHLSFGGVGILHLASNKHDPWAQRWMRGLLEEFGYRNPG